MPDWKHTLTVDASYDDGTGTTGVGVVVQARSEGTRSGRRGPIVEQIAEGHAGVMRGAGELLPSFELCRSRVNAASSGSKCVLITTACVVRFASNTVLVRPTLGSRGACSSSLGHSNGLTLATCRVARTNARTIWLVKVGTCRPADKSDPREMAITVSFEQVDHTLFGAGAWLRSRTRRAAATTHSRTRMRAASDSAASRSRSQMR
jgi:hypothetical protein